MDNQINYTLNYDNKSRYSTLIATRGERENLSFTFPNEKFRTSNPLHDIHQHLTITDGTNTLTEDFVVENLN